MSALASTAVDLARIQFATTSIYHFLFVPLTLGLGPLVAIMQTLWYRTGDEAWLRLTRFFGTLFLINFAIGVATAVSRGKRHRASSTQTTVSSAMPPTPNTA